MCQLRQFLVGKTLLVQHSHYFLSIVKLCTNFLCLNFFYNTSNIPSHQKQHCYQSGQWNGGSTGFMQRWPTAVHQLKLSKGKTVKSSKENKNSKTRFRFFCFLHKQMGFSKEYSQLRKLLPTFLVGKAWEISAFRS